MTNIGDNMEKELKSTHSNSDNSQIENQTNSMNNPTTTASSTTGVPDNSPPMAVLPLNSSSKLDQEPNPFEQSFSGISNEEKTANQNKLTLPPVASITSPAITKTSLNSNHVVIGGGILPKEVTNQFTWDTLRTGPLSPSMLQGPANPDDYYQKTNGNTSNLVPPNAYTTTRSSFSNDSSIQYMQQHPQQHPQQHQHPIKIEQQQDLYIQQQQKRQRSLSQPDEDHLSMDSNESKPTKTTARKTRRRSSHLADSDDESTSNNSSKKKTKASSKEPEDDEKRKNFLERNRIAALKCRQRKKQWLNNLQAKVEFLSSDNERLQLQSESLKEEIVNLKTLLLAHKECPVAQSNGFHASAIQKGGAMASMLNQQSSSGVPYGMNNRNNSLQSSTSSIPRYTRIQQGQEQTSMVNNNNNSSGGGTSSVIRF